MEADALGAAADEVDSTSSPSTEELPMPVFLHRHRRGLHRTSRMVSPPLRHAQAESGSPRSWRTASGGRSGERGDEEASSGEAMSQESDPWLSGDPWQRGQENYEPKYDNWSSPSSSVSGDGTSRRSSSNDSWQYIQDTSRESRHVYWADGGWSQSQWGGSQEDDKGSSWSWSSSESGWSGTGPNQWGWRDDLARNWETDSERSGTSDWSSSSWKTAREDDGRAGGDWGRTSSGLQGGQERGAGVCAGDRAAAGRPTSVGLPAGLGEGPQVHHGDLLRSEASSRGEHDKHDGVSPMSPAAQPAGEWNRPSGLVPSGQPSVAGGSGGAVGGSLKEGTTGKISTTYPPIFYARPGESWEQYWRTVTFWLASEGKSLPAEMRGPRLMQQLRERAGKIVQHLTVEEVTSEQGVQLIKQEMEKSPIIRLLDNKKIDKRRQKFMKLTRLANESIESFINRAEIYRRENEASPAYRVGSCFYVGHLLDSAKLTRKDLGLLKAACGGDVEDETKVISAMLELAEQFEGAPHCPIGRGEPQLDNEDQYLIQKPGTSSSSTPPTSASEHTPRRRPFSRGRGGGGFGRFRRGRIRDALVAILEEEDDGEGVAEELAEVLGEDSMDEEEERGEQASDLTEFNDVLVAGSTSEASSTATPLAEINAQEYKARNRVREIKKMRQYFQKEAPGGPAAARNEHVKKWVAEQQKKEPCFICHQLGHWSQECPYRRKEKPMVHSANVTFPSSQPQQEDWALLETLVSAGVYMVHHSGGEPVGEANHEIFWALDELAGQQHSKMIVDLGCMRTVAGTTWINRIVPQWKEKQWFIKVVPEAEQFRFGDGQVVQSKFAVLLEVAIAGIHGVLRISVVHGTCPPLLSKPVCSALGLVIDTASHTVSSRRFGVKGYGLEQSKGGHYVIPINDFGETTTNSISSDFVMQERKEIVVMSDPRGSAIRDRDPDAPSSPAELAHVQPPEDWRSGGLRAQSAGMGKRGAGQRVNELEEMSAQEEDTTGVASLRHPMRTMKRQSLNRMLRKPTSTSPPGRKTMSKMTKGRDSKTREPDQPASSSEAQMNMAQIQAMMVRMQEMMMALGMSKEQEVEADQGHDPGQRHRGRSQEPAKTKDKVKKTPRAVRTAALTGDEAPFPSLSTQFSDDPTMNLMISLRSQTLTFKWKLLLLMLRIKRAVEVEKRRRKRNLRWIMKLHGNHIASLRGHLGAARQLCYSPKVAWLAQ